MKERIYEVPARGSVIVRLSEDLDPKLLLDDGGEIRLQGDCLIMYLGFDEQSPAYRKLTLDIERTVRNFPGPLGIRAVART